MVDFKKLNEAMAEDRAAGRDRDWSRNRRSSGPQFHVELIERAADVAAAPAALITSAQLSDDQTRAFESIMDWFKRAEVAYSDRDFYEEADPDTKPPRQFFTMGGLAGTGKTTLVSALLHELRGKRVICAAYTGKAVDVLRRKLAMQGLSHVGCATLHSLMYWPRVVNGRVAGWELKPDIGSPDLVVVDEASMISAELWKALLSYGHPILAVGDHGQLPPVGNDAISLLSQPDVRLEKIHRQAEGNPIIAFAHYVRGGGNVKAFSPSDDRVRFIPAFSMALDILAPAGLNAAAICYFNKTRCAINMQIRRHRQYVGPDVVMCLKNAERILFNGMRGSLQSMGQPNDLGVAQAVIEFADNDMRITGPVCLPQFGREKTFAHYDDIPTKPKNWQQAGLLFDFGYAVTCHKSQGSQWSDVVLKYEVFRKDTEDTRRRWLYTAITRASERLYMIR